ncbi:MAG: NYN domain-containing protein [Blastochloris sp.]|nr:NYN domain-containing protein [Blastochloris sp.]
MKKYLLVDGHSVIFNWPELRALHNRNRTHARDLLSKQLSELHETSDWLVTLVYDGKQGTTPLGQVKGMVTIYSQEGQTADSIIERLVAQVPDKGRVVVITADQAERNMVESLGAYSHSPEWLAQELAGNGRSWTGTLDQVHQRAKW